MEGKCEDYSKNVEEKDKPNVMHENTTSRIILNFAL
jgi:hypothetical protein